MRLLDCTLREGTHLTEGQFGSEMMVETIESLSTAGIDVIEMGFLSANNDSLETSYFNSVESAEDTLARCDIKERTDFALMVRPDRFDVDELKPCHGKCTTVRVAFYQKDMDIAVGAVETLVSLGYDVFLNPIATSTYQPADVATLAKKANNVDVRGVNIVDTFGSLSRDKAFDIYYRLHERLDLDITLGVHLHQNLGLSQAIARGILEQKPDTRDLIIDGSLYGMGRSPGNLQIESFAAYLNNTEYDDYDLRPLFEAIDANIQEMKNNFDWGYSPEYMISARHNVHRTYAEKMKADGAPLSDIAELCRSVSGSTDAVQYNEERIKQYYDR